MLLNGLRVIDFTSYIAGPGAAGILADWGADVIKVERPDGDSMRHIFADAKTELASNPVFDLDNRGKRGIVLDIAKPAGRAALARLAADADIFLTNVRPASLKRAGLDDETLRAANPRLVYGVITGYGLDGPEAHKPGFDVTAFWARAGVASMHTPKGMDPLMIRTGVGDHITSLATVSALLAAIYEREQTGVGRVVHASLLGSGVYMMSSDLALQLRFGKLASARPRTRPLNPLANFYQSQDGRWFIHNPRGGGGWETFMQAAGVPELLKDERFTTGRARRQNAEELVKLLEQAFAQLPFAEIARRFDEADLVWAPMQSPADVVDDPQAIAAGVFTEVEDGQGGVFRSPAAPATFPGLDAKPRPPAPQLGQHTREVLSQAGYSEAEIDGLIADGAAA